MLICIHHPPLETRVMRPVMVLGSALGVTLFAGACVTTNGSATSSRYGSAPATSRFGGALDVLMARDSAIAQAFADREGPRVSIRAQVSSFADSRRVRG